MVNPASESSKPQAASPDPRAAPRPFSWQGVLIGLAITVFAVGMALASIYFRRTQTEKTRAFWGNDVLISIQSGRQMELAIVDRPDASPSPSKIVSITDLPGLGHFRHAILDQRHYAWEAPAEGQAIEGKGIEKQQDQAWFWLRIENPRTRKMTSVVVIGVEDGRIGPPGPAPAGQLLPRVQKGVRNFLETLYEGEVAVRDQTVEK